MLKYTNGRSADKLWKLIKKNMNAEIEQLQEVLIGMTFTVTCRSQRVKYMLKQKELRKEKRREERT